MYQHRQSATVHVLKKQSIRQSSEKCEVSKAMDGTEDDLFKWIHLIALTTILKIRFRRMFKKVSENVGKDIAVTFDSSSYKNSTDGNVLDYDSSGL